MNDQPGYLEYKKKQKIDDEHPYLERMKDVAPRYMANDRAHDFEFVFRDGNPLEIAGRPANPHDRHLDILSDIDRAGRLPITRDRRTATDPNS